METIAIGILGHGTVGTGVVRILRDNARAIEGRLGARIEVRKIAVRNRTKQRSIGVEPGMLTERLDDVLDDRDIRIVVELIGGTDEARRSVLRAIANGKHVVTANKALLALHGDEIFAAANAAGVDVHYEAAVCGGIPIIRTLRESFASDEIHAISGILNGTTNYILTAMSERGAEFGATLADAQRLGYAEADPSADVDGHDAAQKLAILASLGFSTRLGAADVEVEGIREVTRDDIDAARTHGYAVKLIAIAERRGDAVAARVSPCWVSKRSTLAHVDGVLNGVLVKSEALGTSILIGRGAGELPTGSAVAADVIDAARNIMLDAAGRVPHRATKEEALSQRKLIDPGSIETPFYLRFSVIDSPGVLARIAGSLAERRVSLRAVRQDERGDAPESSVPVVVITHAASANAVRAAVDAIDRFDTTTAKTRVMRIQDFD